MLDKTSAPSRDRIRAAVDGAAGYWSGPLLTHGELTHVRGLIDRQFSRRIEERAPQHAAVFADAGIQRYHLHSHLIDHAAAWPRRARLFPADGIAFLLQSSVLRRLA